MDIPVSNYIIPRVAINRRAKRRFAACKDLEASGGSGFLVEVSEILLNAEPRSIKSILAHEILHTCRGCYNHGKLWKHYADRMNRYGDYRITTTTTYEDLGLEAPVIKREAAYIITCQKCGSVFTRQKRSKLISHTQLYRCKCGGRLYCRAADHLRD